MKPKQLLIPGLIITFLFLSDISSGQAPADCEGQRYTTEINYDFNIEQETVQYGRNVNAAGDTLDLKMTIFYPSDDVIENRPAIVLGFGGAFIGGERENLFLLCERLAERGVVAVTIDYRIFPIAELGLPNLVEFYDTAIKAIGDMKAAIRHIRLMADHGNTYGIDPDRILAGGISAGAIAALHVGALSEDDLLSPTIDSLITANGGLEGNTGDSLNLSYSSNVSGIVNLSGALLDTTLLSENDSIAIMSIHGTADGTVPFNFGKALNLIPMYGSNTVHLRALHQNLNSRITIVEGGDHTDIYMAPKYEEDRIQFFKMLDTSFLELFCDAVVAVENVPPKMQSLSVFPNPATHSLQWDASLLKGRYQVGIYNEKGELVVNKKNTDNSYIDISNLTPGNYIILLKPLADAHKSKVYQAKFIKQ